MAKLGSANHPPPKSPEPRDVDADLESESTSPKPSASSSQQPQSTGTAPPQPRPKINITSLPASSQSQANPFSQLGVTSMSTDEPSSPGSPRTRKRPAQDIDDDHPATTQARKQAPRPSESDEDYTNRILSQIFRISVDPHQMQLPQGRPIFLRNLNQELNEGGEPLKLSLVTLDQAIIEAASEWPRDSPLLSYLLPCWKRAVKASSTAKNLQGSRLEVHEEAKRLCLSNCLFAVTMPILYGYVSYECAGRADAKMHRRESNPNHDSLAPYLLKQVTDEQGVDLEFIKESIKRFDDDDTIPGIFNEAMVSISTKLSHMSMQDDYRPYVQVSGIVQSLVQP